MSGWDELGETLAAFAESPPARRRDLPGRSRSYHVEDESRAYGQLPDAPPVSAERVERFLEAHSGHPLPAWQRVWLERAVSERRGLGMHVEHEHPGLPERS